MLLSKVSSYKPEENVVFLVENSSDLKSLPLTEAEAGFVRQEFENKTYHVCLNRFAYWIIIQSYDPSKNENQTRENLRKAGYSICQLLQKQKQASVVIDDKLTNPAFCGALAEGLALSNYQFIKYQKTASEKASTLTNVAICSSSVSEDTVVNLNITIEAVFAARDLVNEPVSVLNSLKLAEEFKKLSSEGGFSIEVFDKEKIQELKMGGLLAVNQGSKVPPTFSVMEWKPSDAQNKQPIVLVGKGIVYDTGGLSLKPTRDSMDFMKSDMAGAAAVAGVMYAIARMKLPLFVIGLVPSTDNWLSENSYAPGDIITISDGTTVEVLNTDAEGRLILADALCYAKQYTPELVIDVATLTGAAHVAIGSQGVVGMGNAPEEVMSELVTSGMNVHERIALFPFWDDYAEMIKSDIADLKNIGGSYAGAITAGKFLEYFTDYPYFHLDIAGTAFMKSTDSYRGNGATGFGVRLLVDFLTRKTK